MTLTAEQVVATMNQQAARIHELEAERDRYRKVAEEAWKHRRGQCDWLTDPDLDAALAAVGMKVQE